MKAAYYRKPYNTKGLWTKRTVYLIGKNGIIGTQNGASRR